MTGLNSDNRPLIRLHTSLWWLLLIWFGLVTVLLLLDLSVAVTLATAGLFGILVATLGRLIQLGILFGRRRKPKAMWLSLVLIVLLLATGLLRYLIA